MKPRGEGLTSPVDDPVERVVMQVNAIYQAANLRVALAIGELVIRSFYDGDVSRWRNRGRRKSGALRRLAKHPKLPMSAGTLYRNIAMYEICERLGVWSWKHVCASHFRSVLPLAREEQARLLMAAEENAWSPRQFDHEVTAVRALEAPRPSRGGRPRASVLAKVMRSIQSVIDSTASALNSEDVGQTSADEVRAAVQALGSAKLNCERLRSRLARTLEGSATTPPPPGGEQPVSRTAHHALTVPRT